MTDKNGTELNTGDMIRFKEDRYTQALGVIEKITDSGNLWVTVCGGGGRGNRLVQPQNSKKVDDLQQR